MNSVKKIMNLHEEATYRELHDIASEYGYSVHVKMRIADVFSITNSGLRDDLYSFALKAHFDFTVCDENNFPIFAVEFDGPSHLTKDQIRRDDKKNQICALFDFPMLRIESNHLLKRYNKASLLRWIISAWELQKSFDEGQEKGQIPLEEDFDPILLWHPGKTIEEIHPHWIALKPRLHIQKLHESGRIPQSHACGFTFVDSNNAYRGIEWIDVAENKVVFVESAMRRQQFPIYLGELFVELMTVLTYDKMITYLKSGGGWVEPLQVEQRFNELKNRFDFAQSHTGPTCVNISLSWNPNTNSWV